MAINNLLICLTNNTISLLSSRLDLVRNNSAQDSTQNSHRSAVDDLCNRTDLFVAIYGILPIWWEGSLNLPSSKKLWHFSLRLATFKKDPTLVFLMIFRYNDTEIKVKFPPSPLLSNFVSFC